jgi:hypothetical protein
MDADRRARLGVKWTCGECGAPFYDLCKPAAVCPRCNATQTERASGAAAKLPRRAAKKAKTRGRDSSRRYLEATEADARRASPPAEADDAVAEIELEE